MSSRPPPPVLTATFAEVDTENVEQCARNNHLYRFRVSWLRVEAYEEVLEDYLEYIDREECPSHRSCLQFIWDAAMIARGTGKTRKRTKQPWIRQGPLHKSARIISVTMAPAASG